MDSGHTMSARGAVYEHKRQYSVAGEDYTGTSRAYRSISGGELEYSHAVCLLSGLCVLLV